MTIKNSRRVSWNVHDDQSTLIEGRHAKTTGVVPLRYRRAWSFPPLVEGRLERMVEPPSLNVCSGTSMICDLKVDLHMHADIKADMSTLPFPNESFQTVFSDPPWHMAYTLRPKFLWEMRRITKKGGKFILCAPWMPKIPKMVMESTIIGVPKAFWKNAIPITTYRKPLDDLRGFEA